MTSKSKVVYWAWLLVAVASACASETETPLGSESGLSASELGSVQCSAIFSKGTGQLVDPPDTCLASWSDCSDGKVYQVQCDGLECLCLVDGWPQPSSEGFRAINHCPEIDEAASYCAWPIRLPTGVDAGSAPFDTAPCNDAISDDDRCQCLDGRWSCPGVDGCTMSGSYVASGLQVPTLQFHPDGSFYVAVADENATEDELRSGAASGFFGSWLLQGDVLSLRSYHNPASEDDCSGLAGRYAVEFNESCELTSLTLLDDACHARQVLATSFDRLD